MSALSKAVGLDIGDYIGQICVDFGIKERQDYGGIFQYDIPTKSIKSSDVKAEIYYTSCFNGTQSTKINACLVLFQATINFLNYVLPCLVKESTDTTFKMRFVNLYHIVSSLKQLQNNYHTLLTSRSNNYLDSILNDTNLNLIVSQPHFRNIVVHYGIRNISENQIDRSKGFFGLVEHFYPGHCFITLDQLLNQQIDRIAIILTEWAKK